MHFGEAILQEVPQDYEEERDRQFKRLARHDQAPPRASAQATNPEPAAGSPVSTKMVAGLHPIDFSPSWPSPWLPACDVAVGRLEPWADLSRDRSSRLLVLSGGLCRRRRILELANLICAGTTSGRICVPSSQICVLLARGDTAHDGSPRFWQGAGHSGLCSRHAG